MKKFLTVLLALSVVFTYSFSAVGTAFADTTDYDATSYASDVVKQQQDELAGVVKEAKSKISYTGGYVTAIAGYNMKSDYNALLSEEAVDYAIAQLVTNVYNQKIYDKAYALAKNGTLSKEEVAQVAAEWEAVNTYSKVLNVAFESGDNGKTYNKAFEKQVELDKAAALATIKAAEDNAAAYSAEDYMKPDGSSYTYIKLDDRKYVAGVSEADMLAAAVKDAKEAVDALSATGVSTTDAATVKEIRDAVAAFNGNFKAGNTAAAAFFAKYADPDHGYFMTLADRKAALTTYENKLIKDMEAKAQAFEEATTKTLQETIADPATAEKDKAKAQEKLAVLPANMTTLLGAYTARIGEIQIDQYYTPLMAYEALASINGEYAAAFTNWDKFEDAVEEAAGLEKLIAYATSYASTLKTTYVDGTTNLKYDADVINTILETAIQQIKDGSLATQASVKNYMDTYADTLARAEVALAKARVDALAKLATSGSDAIAPASNYSDPTYASLDRLTEINALRDAAVADVNAAKSVKEIQNIVAGFQKAVDAYLTDAQCKTVVESAAVKEALTGKPVGSANSFAGLLKRDVDAYFVGKTGYSDATKDAIKAAIESELKVAACRVGSTALTAQQAYDEMVKAYNSIFNAEIAKAKTSDEIAAAAKNVVDLIAAIETPVTQASRDKIVAARDAYDAYTAIPGAVLSKVTNYNNLTYAEDRLQYLDKAEILAAYAGLANKDITVGDKATVLALNALEAAYEDNWGEDSPYVSGIAAINEKYEKAAVQDFINKAGQIPTPVTAADKAVVEAAKEAYAEVVRLAEENGYTEEYLKAYLENTYGPGNAVYTNVLKSYLKMEAADSQIAQLAVKAVEALKITAGSTAAKGSITVKWTVKGDTSAVEGYEIWRSTKKNSGFSKFFTTTKTTYKNTKSLKKGTRYYYKVRAIAHVDGKKITSDWSNKAYRIAK